MVCDWNYAKVRGMRHPAHTKPWLRVSAELLLVRGSTRCAMASPVLCLCGFATSDHLPQASIDFIMSPAACCSCRPTSVGWMQSPGCVTQRCMSTALVVPGRLGGRTGAGMAEGSCPGSWGPALPVPYSSRLGCGAFTHAPHMRRLRRAWQLCWRV